MSTQYTFQSTSRFSRHETQKKTILLLYSVQVFEFFMRKSNQMCLIRLEMSQLKKKTLILLLQRQRDQCKILLIRRVFSPAYYSFYTLIQKGEQ